VRVGISGWRYPPWRGVFYPPALAQRRELEFASRQLPTIELNGSFYSLQRPENYQAWYDETPDDFVFSVKGGRYITHMLRLRGVESALANFFASGLANLGKKLGPLLWQLPPNLQYDPDVLENFLAMLPHDTDAASALARRRDARMKGRARIAFGPPRPLRHAIEVRHDSFVDPRFIDQLRRHRVAFVIADTAGKWPQYEDVTADFVYVRLHGAVKLYTSRYTEEELDRFAARIDCWRAGKEPVDTRRIDDHPAPRAKTRDVFCYFDNTDKIEAPHNAMRLNEKLGVKWPTDASSTGVVGFAAS
jgi:uncharacterized protein YecE (DUF72 family)